MNETQLLRYSRQILLPQIQVAGQEKLAQSRVLIIGLGGLGSPVAMYLATAGVGHLVLADFDRVDLPNLQRQILYDGNQVGQYKALSAQVKLHSLNPNIQITPLTQRLTEDSLHEQVKLADAVVDCTDNFITRFTINEACVHVGTPLISGAAIRFSGQVSVFLPAQLHSPCYRCLYTDEADLTETCSEAGILAPLVGVVGSIQAVETIKVLLQIGQILCGKLLLLDAYTMQWRTVKITKDPACPVCASKI